MPEHSFIKMKNGKEFNCFSGNDGDLIYWYDCLQCQGVFAIDNSDEACILPLLCPICEPIKKHTAHCNILTAKEIVNEFGVFELIEIYRESGLI